MEHLSDKNLTSFDPYNGHCWCCFDGLDLCGSLILLFCLENWDIVPFNLISGSVYRALKRQKSDQLWDNWAKWRAQICTGKLQLNWTPSRCTHKNQFPRKPQGLRQIWDHIQKTLGEENPDLLRAFFVWFIFGLLLFKQILLVESCCA